MRHPAPCGSTPDARLACSQMKHVHAGYFQVINVLRENPRLNRPPELCAVYIAHSPTWPEVAVLGRDVRGPHAGLQRLPFLRRQLPLVQRLLLGRFSPRRAHAPPTGQAQAEVTGVLERNGLLTGCRRGRHTLDLGT